MSRGALFLLLAPLLGVESHGFKLFFDTWTEYPLKQMANAFDSIQL